MSSALLPIPNTEARGIGDMVSLLAAETLSVARFGAKPDGMILTDGAITATDKTFTSASATFTPDDVGVKTIFVEGAGASGLDLLTTIASYNGPSSVELTDAAGTTVTGALTRYGTDNTSFIQKAFDESLNFRDCGVRIRIPRGRYLTTGSLTLRNYLSIEGQGFSLYGLPSSPSLILCCADVPALNSTVTTGDGLTFCGVKGITVNGTKRTGSKGIYTAKATGLYLKDSSFAHFGDQGIHLAGGVFDNHIHHCGVLDACLVRMRAAYVGCIDVAQTDVQISKCLAGASIADDTAGLYGTGFIAAFALRLGNSWITDCMGAHSQIGFWIGPSVSDLTMTNCRSDHNEGHGWVIEGSASHFLGCRAFADGNDADGTYDGFLVSGGQNLFSGCQINNFGYAPPPASPNFNRYKYGFHLTTPSGLAGNSFANCVVAGYAYTDSDYGITGTQPYHPIVDLTVFDPQGSATQRVRADLALQDHPLIHSQTSGPTDEKHWAQRLNYGVGYSQRIHAALSDDRLSETIYMIESRAAGVGMGFVEYLNVLLKASSGFEVTGTLAVTFGSKILFNGIAALIYTPSSPEGVETADPGSIAFDGGDGEIWKKKTGSGNTGWERLFALDVSGLASGKPIQWNGSTLITDKIDLATPTDDITGTLGIGNGGTGATTASGARSALSVPAIADVYDKTASDARYYTKAQVDSLLAAADAAALAYVRAIVQNQDTLQYKDWAGGNATELVLNSLTLP